ncbi:uncharacterized protein B0T15DRAFT_89740 [Chaetomium strumarium]|uniref:Uncharacterized protein n=1 Tax=Chaetomium strumarium TaxID=1170767 RepID=A0AAJ0GXH1_9PEZI|nr:hypothetical protein B0T15DRAFT_89740 [Chaetomium strumarium]
MFVKQLLPAFVAIGSVAAQTSTCTVSTTTVNSQADATKLADCDTVKGSVVVGTTAGDINLDGPKEITGDFKVLNNGAISQISSSSLEKVGGAFTMTNVTKLNTINFSSLTSVQSLSWQSLTGINSVTLGPLREADSVIISDTFLNNLDAFNLSTVKVLNLNNNRRLVKISNSLKSLSDFLNIQANGLNLEVEFPDLIWIANMTVANVTKFSIPSLKVVNGSARFDSNFFTSFSAPNLTKTESGDISFVGNAKLQNMTFPKLTAIGGGLLVANNTGLDKIDAFNKLETVGGAVKLRGNFTDVSFPELDVVKGAFDVSSTADIDEACDKLKELAPRSQGGSGNIQGTWACTSNNSKANEDTDSSTSAGGSSGGSNGSNDENGAAGIAFNAALLGLVGVAAFASAL